MITINVGTLVIIILVVVSSCTITTLLFLYCWSRVISEISCSRCHQIIAVQGMTNRSILFFCEPALPCQGPEKPRQLVQQYFVVEPENVPEIVIDQPQPQLINCGDLTTFQVSCDKSFVGF